MIMGSNPSDAVEMLQFSLVNQGSIFMSPKITVTILTPTIVDNALFTLGACCSFEVCHFK